MKQPHNKRMQPTGYNLAALVKVLAPAVEFGVVWQAYSLKETQMTKGKLKEKVLEAVESNHIWLNAFAYVHPTDEQLLELGRMVHQKLRDKELLLPSYHGGSDDEEVDEISKLTPQLYMRVNMS